MITNKTKKKEMEDEKIYLKNTNEYPLEEETDKTDIKNIIIGLLILFLIISLILNLYFYFNGKKTTSHLRIDNNRLKNSDISTNNMYKYYHYNINMNNIEDFFSSENLLLSPGRNCPNRDIKTFFFKPKLPKEPYQYIKFQKKNISLELRNTSYLKPTAFTEDKYEMREIFLKRLGFELDTNMNVHNLYITSYSITNKIKNNMNKNLISKYQKINRFYNYQEYVSKSLLYDNYKVFEDKYPDEYNYMLESYSFPKEKIKIESKFKNYKLEKNDDVWMIKPNMGSLGSKISILTNYSDIKLKSYLLTKYLHNPHLIKGYKYDLRFHGLVSTIKPLKLYLYNEGLVRIASEKYNVSSFDPNNKFAFLTNLFINKKNKDKFIYPKNLPNMEDSNLWNLETFQKYCARNNINYNELYYKVADIFIKMVLTVREKILNYIEENNLETSNFYHLIGIDIILDNNLKPYLLETNRRCGFRDNNDAEKYFTHNIVADTLNIIGIRPKQLDIVGEKKSKEELLKENLKDSFCELDRPRGGYELIFPLKNNVEKYKKFFGNNITDEDKELWEQLNE